MSSGASKGAKGGGLVAINAGSSSIKFALYALNGDVPAAAIVRGAIEGIDSEPRFSATNASGAPVAQREWGHEAHGDLDGLLRFLVEWIGGHLGDGKLVAAGHRVVLGGLEHSAPSWVDASLMDRLRAAVPLAPLHLPRNLEPIDVLRRHYPYLQQVACFDTAFHRTVPHVAELYGLPRHLTEAGARRYGFHGLSYEYVSEALGDVDPAAASGRTVVAHLGSGASMCAMVGGRSVATTMGFSALSGIMMGTRPGDLDSGLLLWLLDRRKMSVAELGEMLYRECGLLGVSGISGDMRVLVESQDPRAKEAIELFVYRIARELGSLAAAAGGLDALVFTGGIGENAASVRAAICRSAAWLGVELDEAANDRGAARISAPGSRVSAWMLRTDEELMIARHTAELLAQRRREVAT